MGIKDVLKSAKSAKPKKFSKDKSVMNSMEKVPFWQKKGAK